MVEISNRLLTRWWVSVGVVAAALLTATGCQSILGEREHQERMDEIAAEVEASLAAHPDVTRASVGYSDHIQDPGPVVGATIFIRSDVEPDPVADEAVRLIWLSEIAPLYTISVSVQDSTTNLLATTRVLHPDGEDQAQLEREYGPRPKQSG